ncbi:hypothetical protein GCM10028801_44830 [Nocardioides maradonensis]
MTATVAQRDQAYHSIFVTALEGGIGYWSRCRVYRWMKEGADPNGSVRELHDTLGFYAEIIDIETTAESYDPKDHPAMLGSAEAVDGEEYAVFRIDREVIARGVRKFIAKAKEVPWLPASYFGQAAVCLDWAKWDDLDIDADVADMIVQLGLFGEAIYG